MEKVEQNSHSELLEFINQCPFALIKANKAGEILLLNAEGSQLLFPISFETQQGLSNVLDLIGAVDPEFRKDIEAFSEAYGKVCSNRRLKVYYKDYDKTQYFSFTIIRIAEDLYQYSFIDVTDIVEAEHKMREITEATALQAGKLEMSSGILHDIGNAVTAFGSEVAKLKGDLDWREIKDLSKLIKLFTSKSAALDQALGGGKGQALLKFTSALEGSLSTRQDSYQTMATQLYETTSHIQDILNIQRHYVKGKTKGTRAPIKLSSIVNDALAIQEKGLVKRGISIHKDMPLDLPPIHGDKTKLIQVLINILKNSGEAYDEVLEEREKSLSIALSKDQDKEMILLEIQDNAIGFDPELGARLLEKGNTTKATGTGFGLYNCKQIVDTHQGEFTITSEGKGHGARVRILLPFVKDSAEQEKQPVLSQSS